MECQNTGHSGVRPPFSHKRGAKELVCNLRRFFSFEMVWVQCDRVENKGLAHLKHFVAHLRK